MAPTASRVKDGAVRRLEVSGATTSTKSKVEIELDLLLGTELPKAVVQFVAEYEGLQREDLLKSPDPAAAKKLGQVLCHLRDISWRHALTVPQCEQLGSVVGGSLPSIQAVIANAGSLTFLYMLNQGVSSAELIDAASLGLEVSTLYCDLVSTFGAPPALVVEEVGNAIVKSLKEFVKQIVMPVLCQSSEDKRTPADAEGGGKVRFTRDEVKGFCTTLAVTMGRLHEFLCRHRLADDQLHQIVHTSLGVFFFWDPDFRLCAAAEELLVTIFCRQETIRSSILQEFLVRASKLPSRAKAKKFRFPVAEDHADYGLSVWTHLLLRLVQSTCLPLREPLGSDIDFSTVLSRRAAGQMVMAQLTGGLVQRLLMTRTKDDELFTIFEELTDELLTVSFKPPWPSALALCRAFVQQLRGVLEPQKKGNASSAKQCELALKLLGKIIAHLSHHHTEALRSHIALPSWSDAPETVPKEERVLQNTALRVSLEDGREMPWSEAARAVKNWDAELLVRDVNDDTSGLCHFSDDIAFMYLIMAHLEDERNVPARCPPASASVATLSGAVFPAGHPIHAWSFLVCEWAEAADKRQRLKAAELREGGESQADEFLGLMESEASKAVVEKFLSYAWTSQTPLSGGDGGAWRSGGGRRVLLPFTVYKVYRQLRCAELDSVRKATFDCIVRQANSPAASLRKSAMRCLADIIDADGEVIERPGVEETIDMRLCDESSWVRQVSLDLLGHVLEGSLAAQADAGEDGFENSAEPISSDKVSPSASSMLLRFQRTVRGRINDTSVLVRRQATKILSAFVLNHPEHPDVVDVCLDLLRRSTDSDLLRNLVLGTFELLWFADDEPQARAAKQLARVIDASCAMGAGPADMLNELLTRFKKGLGTKKKDARGFEHAVRRWTTLILNEFVQLGGDCDQKEQGERWLLKRSLLSALEAFAIAQPREMLIHLRPLTVEFALDETASQEERWVAVKVCQILSAVLPSAAERRGLMDHRQVQQDLQVLIKNQPSTGVHEAVCCLCLVVKHITGDLNQLLVHLNASIPVVSHLCTVLSQTTECQKERHIQLMYVSRQVWIISSILESLSVDDYMDKVRSLLKFPFTGGTVASTVADLLVRLHALGEAELQAVIITCLGFFLRGQRSFIKDSRVCEVFSHALSSTVSALRLKALEALSALLAHFGHEADVETRAGAKGFGDSRDGSVAGGKASEVEKVEASAVESAQPLSMYADVVLQHITVVGPNIGGRGPASASGSETNLKIRVEALAVIKHLNQQGLVNPMDVLPKVFALCFAQEEVLAEPAGTMLKQMLELRPTLLLNRMDESLRDAYLATLSADHGLKLGVAGGVAQLAPLCEVYAERFRKQKGHREAFLRKSLREVFRLEPTRFQERFSELISAGRGPRASAVEAASPTKKRRKLVVTATDVGSAFDELPALEYYQLLYAQFIASTITALPFAFESEPLLVVFECNRHLSLHAGAFFAGAEPEDGEAKDLGTPGRKLKVQATSPSPSRARPPATSPSPSRAQSPAADPGVLVSEAAGAEVAAGDAQLVTSSKASEVFSEAVSIMTCLILKGAMKTEYQLTAEQCAQFNPKDPRTERLKCNVSMARMEAAKETRATAPTAGGEEAPVVKVRFPMEEWLGLAEPLAAKHTDAEALAAYARSLTDKDPWDSNHSRHAANLDRLEGRAEKKKGKTGRGVGRGKPRGRAGAADEDGEPAGEEEAAAEGEHGEEAAGEDEPPAPTPSAKRKVAKDKGKAKAKSAKKRKLRGDSEESYTE